MSASKNPTYLRMVAELKKARAQAAGQCDGCGEQLEDAYCTKCYVAKGSVQKLRAIARRLVELQLVHEHCGVDGQVLIGAWHDLQRAVGMEPACRVCGCTEEKACPGGCSWAGVGICSVCEVKS
ncbi:MAG: hypothetical protein PHS14_07625 [Elusimicrobia bacterium]|nr:hypothetical protein [Elusimicrobiota bacterium]